LPDGPADRIAAVAIARLPDGPVDGEALFAFGALPDRPADFNLTFALFAFNNVAIAGHRTIFIDRFILGSLTLDLLLIVDNLTHGATTLTALDAAGGIT